MSFQHHRALGNQFLFTGQQIKLECVDLCVFQTCSLDGTKPFLFNLCRQSWPTRVDMHQGIEDTLASSSISHAGGPQSPARSTESLLNGHRSKGMMDLGRREETSVTDSAQVFITSHLTCAKWIEVSYYDKTTSFLHLQTVQP